MPPKQTCLMLLWHMHQPFYKDLAEGSYSMPWVRLHALKDYYGMVAMLKEFPEFHATFNLVPSLVFQLQEYARDQVCEQAFDLAFKPVRELSPEDREKLIQVSFQINLKNQVNRFPRLRELYDKVHSDNSRRIGRVLPARDLLDLQILSQLAWFDEIYLTSNDSVLNLISKGRDFSEGDKVLVRKLETEIFNVTLEEYRRAAQRGQIEISTSPFYHPILPLLCDTNIALEADPGTRLPHRRYHHPEDAVDQLRSAVRLHEEVFGTRPRGLWPSEGSVSDQVLGIAAAEGFRWTATDEGILARSLPVDFRRQPDGTLQNAHELYRPYQFKKGEFPISIFFRDHYLSDLIGFVYANMPAEGAAHDLHQRIRSAAACAGAGTKVISIILDGENAWEFFTGNGRGFLKSFYKKVVEDPDLKAVTASEALSVCEQGSLTHIVPGSWINSNFGVWIGADEDNRAWDLLAEARDFFEERMASHTFMQGNVERSRQEVWVSEGSDWCWWYGPEHSSGHDEEFDLLYRKHLSNIYRLLGESPPDSLASPIKRAAPCALSYPPTGTIEPTIDGFETNYFEWLGSGLYLPDASSTSMHGAGSSIEALYYGFSQEAFYIRLDLQPAFRQEHSSFEIRVVIGGDCHARLHIAISDGQIRHLVFSNNPDEASMVPRATMEGLQAGFSTVFEARVDYAALGIGQGKRLELQISLWADDLPLQVAPQQGWLTLELTGQFETW